MCKGSLPTRIFPSHFVQICLLYTWNPQFIHHAGLVIWNMSDKADTRNMDGMYTPLTPVSSQSAPGMTTIQIDPNLTAPLGQLQQVTNPGGASNLLYHNKWLWFRLEGQGTMQLLTNCTNCNAIQMVISQETGV